LENIPQGLKPHSFSENYGTTEEAAEKQRGDSDSRAVGLAGAEAPIHLAKLNGPAKSRAVVTKPSCEIIFQQAVKPPGGEDLSPGARQSCPFKTDSN
jgi:hypothetical protein